ncbi:tRNA lysidine(34) synthetase TilS [Rhabdochlamydiaceae symbiont of Dictyostelium giganteum]|uniref:tRNA lysidine(34) synthetase TilS n=1 Tax=Rhabdochlamydiaceae symbiont of Dictyostelium giganteum TaxID=3342349 RepID=UPI003850D21A
MTRSLSQFIKKFLRENLKSSQPVIVAYSGGADSKALLYLLKACMKHFPLNLHVVHVDHGWREESHQELLLIEKEIKELGLPFYGYVIQDPLKKEHAAREHRYALFKELFRTLDAQAVILGHHQDDQVETVLKRVLEGASLYRCSGMTAISLWNEMPLWRPLLTVRKDQLRSWLQKQDKSFIEDQTNLSPLYLRGRLRTALLPQLESVFGKSIRDNLCRLGKRSDKLKQDLAKRSSSLFEMIEEESTIRLSSLRELDEIVLEYFLKTWTEKHGMQLSASQLEALVRIIQTKKSIASIKTGTGCITIGKGRLALKKLDRYLDGKGT